MFIFCFLSENRLNQSLAALRDAAGPFPYKAMLTPTNSTWVRPTASPRSGGSTKRSIRINENALHYPADNL